MSYTRTLDDVYNALMQLIDIFNKEFSPAKGEWNVEQVLVNTTPAPLFTVQKKVKSAIFQNLEAGCTMWLAKGPKGKAGILVAGSPTQGGLVLNPAVVAGLGGGSITMHNIDLSEVTVACSAGPNKSMAVAYYY